MISTVQRKAVCILYLSNVFASNQTHHSSRGFSPIILWLLKILKMTMGATRPNESHTIESDVLSPDNSKDNRQLMKQISSHNKFLALVQIYFMCSRLRSLWEWVVFKQDLVETPSLGFVQIRLAKHTVCMHTDGKYRAQSKGSITV